MNEAFHLLRRYARGNNMRLADVARRLTVGGLDPAVLLVSR
jgi:hypothetical protein